MHNEKKQHIGRRNFLKTNKVNHHRNIRIFNTKQINDDLESLEHKDDEEKASHIYKLFYAELIKLLLIESAPKDLNLTELELDQNIFLAANEYYAMTEDMYEVIKISSCFDQLALMSYKSFYVSLLLQADHWTSVFLRYSESSNR